MDLDKPLAACVYLWSRDPALCDGPAAAGPGFDASLTEGQIILPAGVQCSTDLGSIPAAAIDELVGATGDRQAALTALLTRLVYARHGGAVADADVDRGEQAVVDGGFGGSRAAYEGELSARGLSRKIARDLIADGFRRQAIAAELAVADPGRSPASWLALRHREAFRSAVCLNDEVPSSDVFTWSGLLPFLELPEASVSIAAAPPAVRKGKRAVLFGAVASVRAQEAVTVYARGSRDGSFRPVGKAKVLPDGTWSLEVVPRAKTVYRAVSRSAASPAVVVRVKRRG